MLASNFKVMSMDYFGSTSRGQLQPKKSDNFDVDRPLGKWLRFVNGCLICFVAVR